MKGTALTPRAEELLAERALRPLDERELHELEQLGVANDDSFDAAAAALVIATTPLEAMPEHLADKILAAVPPPDFRRTLPGVVVQPSELPRDTMVGVDIASLAPEGEVERDARIEALPPVTHTLPPSQPLARVVPLPHESMQTPSQQSQTLPPAAVGPRRPGIVSEAPASPSRGGATKPPAKFVPAQTLVPPEVKAKSSTLPPPDVSRPPAADVPRESQSRTLPPPDVSRPPAADVPRASTPPYAQPYVAPSGPQPYVTPPSGPQSYVAPSPSGPQSYVAPSGPQPYVPPSPSGPLPQESLPMRGEVPPMEAPVIDLPTYRMPHAKLEQRKSRTFVPWLAAAACLLVAGGAVWWALARDHGEATVAVQSPTGDRAALLASATDIAKITWTPTQDPAARSGATGDVVWSPSQQRGFMRFVGLTPNDPTQYQYQLWIFDKTRDQAFPVDGGVFDVSSTGEVIVAINPKLHVNDATVFAVTIEKPGGVVVSKRERIVVTAQRG